MRAIDVAFVDEMNTELQAFQERKREAHQREIEAARKPKRGRK